MRDDSETRAELHQQIDDLKEKLWSICDERKEQAENERETNMNDGWLDDRLGVLSNHYLTVMQVFYIHYNIKSMCISIISHVTSKGGGHVVKKITGIQVFGECLLVGLSKKLPL